jgi:retinol dehydrogenase 12
MPFFTTFLYSQFFVTPQLPDHDFSKQTIIITGSNTGLGLEAAKHFLQLHCARLIIAVRNTSKGETAKQSLIDALPQISPSQIQVWPLDLSSSKSVRAFAHRATTELERVDVLVENAGMEAQTFELSEDGWESTLQTNVISTCLLAMLMLPKLKETGETFKTTPYLEVVTSDTHYFAAFAERDAKEGILQALNNEEKFNQSDR